MSFPRSFSPTVQISTGTALQTANSTIGNTNVSTTVNVNRDGKLETISLVGYETQSVYQPTNLTGQIPEIAYVYLLAPTNTGNSGSIDVLYTSGSSRVRIASLKPGDSLYFPFRTLNGPNDGPTSSSLLVVNTTSSAAVVHTFVVESGSAI